MAEGTLKKVRIEINEKTLCRLLAVGHVCAADFRCLDCESKQCLWRLCLESCASRDFTAMGLESVHNGYCRACGRFQ